MDKRFWHKHGSTILTVLASAGVVGTAVLAVKATPKAIQIIEDDKSSEESSTKLELSLRIAKCYIPTFLVGTGTIACVVGANVLNQRQQATLMSAYALVDKSFSQYKGKLIELYGEDTHKNVVDAIAVEEAKEINVYSQGFVSNLSLIPSTHQQTKQLFYDEYSHRYFESSLEQVMSAEYHINRNYILRGYVTLDEFYDFLGIEHNEVDENLGWGISDLEIYWLDFDHRTAYLEDGTEYISIGMMFHPNLEWLELY